MENNVVKVSTASTYGNLGEKTVGKGKDGFKRVLWCYTDAELKHLESYNTVEIENFKELNKEIKFGNKNITTHNLAALRYCQDHFDLVYVDDKMIWPNNEWNSKAIRYAHNIFNLITAWVGEQVSIDVLGEEEYSRQCTEFEKALNTAMNNHVENLMHIKENDPKYDKFIEENSKKRDAEIEQKRWADGRKSLYG